MLKFGNQKKILMMNLFGSIILLGFKWDGCVSVDEGLDYVFIRF